MKKKHINIFVAFHKTVEEDVVRFGDFLNTLNMRQKKLMKILRILKSK